MALLKRHPRTTARLFATLVAVTGCLATAPTALAYTVNTTADTNDGVCDATDCTLREAIDAANAAPGGESITFDIAGPGPHVISIGAALPDIVDPVTIDGTSEPDYGFATSQPAVALVGPGARVDGLHVSAAGTTIQGLAIGGFNTGIYLAAGGNGIGLNRIGTNTTGTVAVPNGTGIFVDPGSSGNVIAFNGTPNLISGNTSVGIALNGDGNIISENLIGITADGAALPNGIGINVAGNSNEIGTSAVAGRANAIAGNSGPGIRLGGTNNQVDGNFIGTNGVGDALGNGSYGVEFVGAGTGNILGGAGNVVAFNGAAGVRVPGGVNGQISMNAIYSNGGLGIDLGSAGFTANGPGGVPNFPDITSADPQGADVHVTGTLNGTPNDLYRFEFFANESCDPSGHGEGQRPLSAFDKQADANGVVTLDDLVDGSLAADEVLTATATNLGGNANTSEFSVCARGAVLPPPVLGKVVNVAPVSGTVLVRRPGGRFKRLRAGQQVPIGSTLDTRRGVVRLTSAANNRGKTQTAKFDSGVFKTAQKRKAGAYTELKLNGPLAGCAKQGNASVSRRRRGRRLWGNGTGRFRSIGSRASAGVRGTHWLVEDRCDGSTLVAVKRGVVTVRDFVRNKTITVKAGHRYVASPRKR